jgi:hypothetical protein
VVAEAIESELVADLVIGKETQPPASSIDRFGMGMPFGFTPSPNWTNKEIRGQVTRHARKAGVQENQA